MKVRTNNVKGKTMKFFSFIKKYLSVILIIGFIVSYLFIVDNSYIDICKNDEKIEALERSIDHEKRTIEKLKSNINEMRNNPETIERVAR